MQAQPLRPNPQSELSGTATSKSGFVETIEYRRFVEFCDACREYRYIGLCFGAPGIGKTLSAARYSQAAPVKSNATDDPLTSPEAFNTVLYTPNVVNTPGSINLGLRHAREKLLGLATAPVRDEARKVLDALRNRDENWKRRKEDTPGFAQPPLQPTHYATLLEYEAKKMGMTDPTTLILIDEADRLGMSSLEQVRSIFDAGNIGLVLIGMPGIEKRMARFPQFYSRIGFVHHYRPLAPAEIERLFAEGWAPDGINLSGMPFSVEVTSAIIRMTSGNSVCSTGFSPRSNVSCGSMTQPKSRWRWSKQHGKAWSSVKPEPQILQLQ